jgi:hypothetical protein
VKECPVSRLIHLENLCRRQFLAGFFAQQLVDDLLGELKSKSVYLHLTSISFLPSLPPFTSAEAVRQRKNRVTHHDLTLRSWTH